eukprot:scaffold6534_cov87-Skeletonema_dohrnii-CCMP3373.AAC.1
MADEDDAFIPEEQEEVVEVAAKEQVEKGIEEELEEKSKKEEDLGSAQEEEVTGTDDKAEDEDNEEEAVSATDENDDQQLEVETESEVEGNDDEDMAEKLEEKMEEALNEDLVSGGSGSVNAAVADEEENVIDESQPKEGEEIEAASETEDESILCQDDPDFEYKGYEGFNCAYIKERSLTNAIKSTKG